MTLRHLLQRQAPTHVRLQQSCIDELRDARQDLSGSLRLELMGCWNAHELVVKGHIPIEKSATVVAGGRAENGYNLSVDGNTIETLLKDLAADCIEHDGNAFALRELLDPFHKIGATVIDYFVRVQDVGAERN